MCWRRKNNCCVEVTLPLLNEIIFQSDMLQSVGCLLPFYLFKFLLFKNVNFPSFAAMRHSLYCCCVEIGCSTETH